MRCELGPPFGSHHVRDATSQRTANAVQRRKHFADRIDDLGPFGRVVDLQIADRFGQHFQLRRGGIDRLLQLFRLSNLLQPLDRFAGQADTLAIGIERPVGTEEIDTTAAQARRFVGRLCFKRFDQRKIDVTQLA